ncbi:MAG: hypothetical protein WAS21_33385, partial [Geminicoccaceae bacterium]
LGNPPFSNRTVRGQDPAGRLGLALHDWFIARSLELLRPGGLAAFVTSRWTLDKEDATARLHLAGMADLLAAVRLLAGALRAAAGTDVVGDLLFLRKRLPDEIEARLAALADRTSRSKSFCVREHLDKLEDYYLAV